MKILIADDHSLFRDGLNMRLKQLVKNAEIIETGDFMDSFRILEENKFDLLILDLDMPDSMPWDEAIKLAIEKAHGAKIAIVSASDNYRDIKKAMDLGVSGYIPKRSDPKILSAALNLIIDGGVYLPPAILDKSRSVSELGDDASLASQNHLTHRQSEVLNLIAEGKSNKQIAYDLSVSEATVKLHINALLRALGATNRTQAVIMAQKEGLL